MSSDFADDLFLLKEIKMGSTQAFRAIYLKYWEGLFTVILHWVKSEDVVKEIVQDLFTQLWCNREKLNIRKSFRAYFFTALKYKVFNYLEAEAVREKYVQQATHSSSYLVDTTEHLIYYQETKSLIEEALKSLSSKTMDL